jgi:hypothetical protein
VRRRRMGWQKPSDYAAEMAQQEAQRESPSRSEGVTASGATHEAGGDASEVTEPEQGQPLRRRAAPRAMLGVTIWVLFVIAAMFLAVGALLVALDADRGNGLVGFVLDAADVVDLGIFSRDGGLMTFTGEDARTQNALVNWGLGAIAWLVVGRIVDRLVRP